MKNENNIKNYGLNVEETLAGIDNTHYLLGSTSKLSSDIIQADHNWRPYIPIYEPQYTPNYDTYGCTVFGSYNAIEILMKKIYGGDYDFAERFTYIFAGVRPPGADPHKVIEMIRTKGMIPQALLPFTETYEQFIQPDPMTPELIDKGLEFLNDKEIGHEWIFTNTPNTEDRISQLKWALERGTVCVSVTAWYQDENGLYIDGGKPNGHWCCLIDLELGEDGKIYPIIIDSYDLILYGKSTAYFKKLHPDHKMTLAKRFTLTPKKPSLTPEKKRWFLDQILDVLKKLFNIQTQVDKLKIQEEQAIKTPTTAPVVVTTPFPEPVAPKYLWDTPVNARHSIRVICDEEGLNLANKDIICKVINGESGFKNTAINRNKNAKGVVTSTDWGICQINDYFHVGVGKTFSSVDDILQHPDKAVRFMVKMAKVGKLNLWVAYSSGSYKNYPA